MKIKFQFILAAAAIAFAASCQVKEDLEPSKSGAAIAPITFNASVETTKASVEGTSVLWEEGDKIMLTAYRHHPEAVANYAVVDEVLVSIESDPLTSGGSNVYFSFTPKTEAERELILSADSYTALYPSSAFVKAANSTINRFNPNGAGVSTEMNFPLTQDAAPLQMSMALADRAEEGSTSLLFKNMLQHIKFNPENPAAKKAVLKNNTEGQGVAYTKPSYNPSKEVMSSTNGEETATIEIEIAEGDNFFSLPSRRTFKDGFRIELYSENDILLETLNYDKEFTTKRNKISNISDFANRTTCEVKATLITGANFNSSIKSLVCGTTAYNFTQDTQIQHVVFNTKSSTTSSIVVSDASSQVPAYASWDPTTKTVAISTAASAFKAPVSCAYMFKNMTKLVDLDLRKIYFEDCTSMKEFCMGCSSLTSFVADNRADEDVDKNFYLYKVTNMSSVFEGCSSLTEVDDINTYADNATTISGIFKGCSSLTSLMLDNWDITEVTDASYAFANCTNLTGVGYSLAGLLSLENAEGMFQNCSSWSDLDDYFKESSITLSKVKNANRMFLGCSQLESIDFSDVSLDSIEKVAEMFSGCTNLKSVDLSKFNAGNITEMYSMFNDCSSLESVDFSTFNTAKVTNMASLLSGCRALESLTLGSNFSTSNVTSFYQTFLNCKKLDSIDLSNFDFGMTTNCEGMFFGCDLMKNIDLSASQFTAGVTNTADMFNGCSALETVNISTMKGTLSSVRGMFDGCSSIASIQFNDAFNTIAVNSYMNMFRYCSSLRTLRVKGFYLSRSITNVGLYFSGTITGVSNCTIYYSPLRSIGEYSSSYCYEFTSMFGFYSSASGIHYSTAN